MFAISIMYTESPYIKEPKPFKGNISEWLRRRGVVARMDFENLCYVAAYSNDELRVRRALTTIFTAYKQHLVNYTSAVAVSTLTPCIYRMLNRIKVLNGSDNNFRMFSTMVYIMNQSVLNSKKNISAKKDPYVLIHNNIGKRLFLFLNDIPTSAEMTNLLINTLKIKITYI